MIVQDTQVFDRGAFSGGDEDQPYVAHTFYFASDLQTAREGYENKGPQIKATFRPPPGSRCEMRIRFPRGQHADNRALRPTGRRAGAGARCMDGLRSKTQVADRHAAALLGVVLEVGLFWAELRGSTRKWMVFKENHGFR